MGRDANRDQDGDLAAWQDLVARFELPQAPGPAQPPWPDRENLNPADELGLGGQSGSRSEGPPGTRTPAARGRVIKPAQPVRYSIQAGGQSSGTAAGQVNGPGEATTHPDPWWLELDAEDEDADHRYIPPHVRPLPKLDPVARGAWTALFGGPGYLFVATALSWQVPGWAELAAIIAFVAGFVVLVSRLGDGPSRRDGPDQGAVV